mmetsp:Transcript_28759/g.82599  ORF Transcript_28759/g.82599 Transcript_28759/m.82599 type:complete len:208 (-) Transcript_28759:1915-2538(-)
MGKPREGLLAHLAQLHDLWLVSEPQLLGHGLGVVERSARRAGVKDQDSAWVMLLGIVRGRPHVAVCAHHCLLHPPPLTLVVVLRAEIEVAHLVVPDRTVHPHPTADPTPLRRHLTAALLLSVNVCEELCGDRVAVHDAELLSAKGVCHRFANDRHHAIAPSRGVLTGVDADEPSDIRPYLVPLHEVPSNLKLDEPTIEWATRVTDPS